MPGFIFVMCNVVSVFQSQSAPENIDLRSLARKPNTVKPMSGVRFSVQ